MKKFVLALLAVVLVLGLCTVAMADQCTTETQNHQGAPVKIQEDTCEQEAIYVRKCTVCGCFLNSSDKKVATQAEAATTTVDDITECEASAQTQVYDSTCYKTGTEVFKCKWCGETLKEETIAKKEHAPYADGEVKLTAATCGKDAFITFKCKYCNDTITLVQEGTALKHDYVKDALLSKDATCTEDGNEYKKCSICGDVQNKGIGKFDHMKNGKTTYAKTSTKVAATCTEGGIDIYTCSQCQATKEVPTAATEHKFNDWHIDVAPTCTKVGSESRFCTNAWCKNPVNGQAEREIREIPALDHDYAWAVLTAAACEKPGVETGVCENCGNQTTRPIAALEHKFGEFTVIKEATDTTCGIKARTCELCKVVDYQTYGLTVDPETPVVPDKPAVDEDDNNSEGSGSTTGSGSDASIPATGDNTSNVPYIMMVAAVAGLVVLVASKRKVNC